VQGLAHLQGAARWQVRDSSELPVRNCTRPMSSRVAASPGRSPGQIEQLVGQREVLQRLAVLAQRAVQAPDAGVGRPALGREIHAPGHPQHLAEVRERLVGAAEPRRHVAQAVVGLELQLRVVLVEQAQAAQVQARGPLVAQPLARVVAAGDEAGPGAARVAALLEQVADQLEADRW
jgi:hypothetical protein